MTDRILASLRELRDAPALDLRLKVALVEWPGVYELSPDTSNPAGAPESAQPPGSCSSVGISTALPVAGRDTGASSGGES